MTRRHGLQLSTGAPSAKAGINGKDGTAGKNGDSAYAVWLAAGNKGDESAFLEAIKGTKGADGVRGRHRREGATPVPTASRATPAYDLWIAAGNTGDQAAFLESLKNGP